MELDGFRLSPYQIADLYKSSLVLIPEAHKVSKPLRPSAGALGSPTEGAGALGSPTEVAGAATDAPLKFMGSHKRKILLLVRDPSSVFLDEKTFQFLISIMDACKISMEDVALVNTTHTGTRQLPAIAQELDSQIIVLFGIPLSEMELPMLFPNYQVQAYGGKTYLGADALSAIAADRMQKGLLWGSLKQLFQL
jgi:hypothetical protein